MAKIYVLHHVKLSEDEKAELEQYAEQHNMKPWQVIREAVKFWLERNYDETSEHVDGR